MTHTMALAQHDQADELLTQNSFALLLGMQLDQQIPMEKAFRGPYELSVRLRDAGHLTDISELGAQLLADVGVDDVVELYAIKPALHRFPGAMAKRAHQLSVLVCDRYDGDAARLWDEAPSGTQLLKRLRELPGFGDGSSRIFLALLGKQRGVRPTGWREACAPFGEAGTTISVADIVDAQSLADVREHKKAAKQAAKQAKA